MQLVCSGTALRKDGPHPGVGSVHFYHELAGRAWMLENRGMSE